MGNEKKIKAIDRDGNEYSITADEALALKRQGYDISYDKDTTIDVVDTSTGSTSAIPLSKYLEGGYIPTESVAAHQAAMERAAARNTPQSLYTLAEGAGSGATFGLTDVVASRVAPEYYARSQERAAANPGLRVVGEIGGALLPALATAGTSTAATAAGTAARGVGAVAKGASALRTAASLTPVGMLARGTAAIDRALLSRAISAPIRMGVTGAVEGGVYSAANAATDALAAPDGNLQKAGEAALSALPWGVAGGGVLGAGIGVAGQGVQALGKAATKAQGSAAISALTKADDITRTIGQDAASVQSRLLDAAKRIDTPEGKLIEAIGKANSADEIVAAARTARASADEVITQSNILGQMTKQGQGNLLGQKLDEMIPNELIQRVANNPLLDEIDTLAQRVKNNPQQAWEARQVIDNMISRSPVGREMKTEAISYRDAFDRAILKTFDDYVSNSNVLKNKTELLRASDDIGTLRDLEYLARNQKPGANVTNQVVEDAGKSILANVVGQAGRAVGLGGVTKLGAAAVTGGLGGIVKEGAEMMGGAIGYSVGGLPGAVIGKTLTSLALDAGTSGGTLKLINNIARSEKIIEQGSRTLVRGAFSIPSAEKKQNKKAEAAQKTKTFLKQKEEIYQQQRSAQALSAGAKSKIESTIADIYSNKMQYLQDSLPPQPKPDSPVDAVELAKFEDKQDIVRSPLSVFDKIKDGTINASHIDALKSTSPELFTAIQQQIINEVYSNEDKDFDEVELRKISIIVNTPLTYDLQNIASIQAAWGYTPTPEVQARTPSVRASTQLAEGTRTPFGL